MASSTTSLESKKRSLTIPSESSPESPKSKKSCSSSHPFTSKSFPLPLPFDVQCEGCWSVLSKNVIVDAEEESSGFSDKYEERIVSIAFKCCCCGNKITLIRSRQRGIFEVERGGLKKSASTCICKLKGHIKFAPIAEKRVPLSAIRRFLGIPDDALE